MKRSLILLVAIILLLVFALFNREDVALSFGFGSTELPLGIALALAFIAGGLTLWPGMRALFRKRPR